MDMITAEEEERDRIEGDQYGERDGIEGPSKKVVKTDSNEHENQEMQFVHAPVIPCVYTDGVTKHEKCMVVLMLYPGVKGLQIDITTKPDSREQILKVKYDWPISMYNVDSMFFDDNAGAMIVSKIDPKAIAVEEALKKYRLNVEDAPTASMEVKLPAEVKIDPTTWKKTFNKKENGGIVVFLEFECVRKEYNICKSEKFLEIN